MNFDMMNTTFALWLIYCCIEPNLTYFLFKYFFEKSKSKIFAVETINNNNNN